VTTGLAPGEDTDGRWSTVRGKIFPTSRSSGPDTHPAFILSYSYPRECTRVADSSLREVVTAKPCQTVSTEGMKGMAASSKDIAVIRTPEHRTVSRVMAILEVVIASEPNGLRLADLPDMVGAPKSTIHGLARGLVATGYVREHNGRYYQGPALAILAVGGQHLPATYHYALEQLTQAWNETAFLATLVGESVINIDVVQPNQMIRASPPLHERRPMWPGSSGKVFLAFMDAKRLDGYLRRKHKDPEEQARIRAEIEIIRSTGIAFNRGETIPELFGVAGPIAIAGMDVSLAIGLAGPADRMRDRLDEIADSVRKTARELSNTGAVA